MLRQGRTQEAVVEAAGELPDGNQRLHKQRLSEIENGQVAEPHARILHAIADGLGTTVAKIYETAQSLSKSVPAIESLPVGRDVLVNLSSDGLGFDRATLISQLEKIGLNAADANTVLGGGTVKDLTRGALKLDIQKSVLKRNLLQSYHDEKYLHLSMAAENVGASVTKIKNNAEQLHFALGAGQYGYCHKLIGEILSNKLFSRRHRSDLQFDYVQTGYLYFANSGNRSAIQSLHKSLFEGDWRKIEPRLLCLLAEMQQEFATRDLDPKLLNDNLESLSRIKRVCAKDSEANEYLVILRAMCLRRIGERGDVKKLDQSIALHRRLLRLSQTRVVEISGNFGNALLRRFEATGRASDLDEAHAVLNRVNKPKAAVLLSEIEAFPRALNALGNVYRHRLALTGRSEDFARAIECYTKAEAYWSEEISPYEWALLQKNKAKATVVFANRHDVSLDLINGAIKQAEGSLRHRTKDEAPYQHAGVVEILEQLKRIRSVLLKNAQ